MDRRCSPLLVVLAWALGGCLSDTSLSGRTPPPDPGPRTYAGGWVADEDCPTRLADQDEWGNDPGDTPPDFELLDQHGESVRLYDFCHHVVRLVWAEYT